MEAVELWTCHLGTVEYREAAALQERLRARVHRRRAAGAAAAARAPGRLHARPPLGARRPAVRRGLLARARDRRRPHAARRQAHLPRPGPARRLPDHARARHPRVRRARWRRALVAALAEEGIAARGRDHEGPQLHRRVGRGPQDRLDRRPRLARRDRTASRSTSTTTSSRSTRSPPAGCRACG